MAKNTKIDTNELRRFADTLPRRARDYLYAVADELGAVRTQRNVVRAQVRKLKAAARTEVKT